MRRTWSLSMLAGAAISMSGAAAVAESDAWSSSNTDEVRALVAEMLADAENRSSLLQGGGSAGHDGKFFLASADGNFRMNVGGQLQFRWDADFRDVDAEEFDGDLDGESDFQDLDDSDWGFEMRRAKLEFSGMVFDKFDYKVVGAFNDNGGEAELEDAYFGWDLGDSGWHMSLGQFKVPLLREELVSSKYQLAIDRSLTNEVFTANRSQGIWFHHAGENLGFDLAISDGVNFNSLPPQDGANISAYNDDSDFAVSARAEYMWTGEWDQFKDFTSAPGSANAGMVGGAVHYQLGADSGGDGPDAPDLLVYTVDVSWESNGWNLFGAFIGNSVDTDDAAVEDPDQMGFVVQGGWYLNEDFELFGRYDYVDYDLPSGTPGNDDQSTITLGFNYYMHGQAAKFSFDFNWALEESFVTGIDPDTDLYTGLFGVDSIGYRGSTDSDEIYLRAQFQLLF